MATALPLKIKPFTNRATGTTSWRVSGMLAGERIRKNFQDHGAAVDWLNKHTPRLPSGAPQPVITHLKEADVRRVEAAMMRLPPGTDIPQAVDFFTLHHRSITPLAAADAVAEFGEWLRRQRKVEQVTSDSREGMLGEFFKSSGVTRSDRITAEAAGTWIYREDRSDRTQRDRFDLLNYFCSYLVKKKHAIFNPVDQLDRPVAKVKVPQVFTFDQVWQLLQCALTDASGPHMLPYFAITALSPVREGETHRLKDWQDIHLTPEHRLIEVNKAKGGRQRRNAPISEPLWRILTWCKKKKMKPSFFSKRRFDRIRERAGLKDKWEKDVLRHTYASAHYVIHKDTKALADIMGNSERVLFQNYIRPIPLAQAKQFGGLVLHYSAPAAPSMQGRGPKPRKKKPATA